MAGCLVYTGVGLMLGIPGFVGAHLKNRATVIGKIFENNDHRMTYMDGSSSNLSFFF